VEYLQSETVIVVRRDPLLEDDYWGTENPSACAAADCEVCK
jgi:hypothetical protein